MTPLTLDMETTLLTLANGGERRRAQKAGSGFTGLCLMDRHKQRVAIIQPMTIRSLRRKGYMVTNELALTASGLKRALEERQRRQT